MFATIGLDKIIIKISKLYVNKAQIIGVYFRNNQKKESENKNIV
jgi:hypothetical protein